MVVGSGRYAAAFSKNVRSTTPVYARPRILSLEEPSVDVALSFLSADTGTARALADRLSQHLSVFIYERAQEDIAGTDGMETFRAQFRSKSRINVILLRRGYGQTPWTRVELAAIQERALADGWDTVVVVALEKIPEVPKWLPTSRIYASVHEFGVEGVAAVITARARDAGAPDRRESPEELGARLARAAQAERNLIEFSWSAQGIAAARTEALAILKRIRTTLSAAAAADETLRFRASLAADQLIAILGTHSLSVYWEAESATAVGGTSLVVIHYDGLLKLPSDTASPGRRAVDKETYFFIPEASSGGSWHWQRYRTELARFSSDDAADDITRRFLQYALARED